MVPAGLGSVQPPFEGKILPSGLKVVRAKGLTVYRPFYGGQGPTAKQQLQFTL